MNIITHPVVRKCFNRDLGLLFIRIGLGIVFITHGWMKFDNMGMTIDFFNSLHLPAFMAYFVAAVELIAGIGIILGVYTRLLAKLLVIDMFFAIGLVTWNLMKMQGFIGTEFEVLLLLVAMGIFMTGAGKYSLMHGKYGRFSLSGGTCDTCDSCKDGCTSHETCDSCDTCKEGCTSHETCDSCDSCKDGCSKHEAKK
jgi:putative oxidoreductase